MEDAALIAHKILRMFSSVANVIIAGAVAIGFGYWNASCEALRGLLAALLTLVIADLITGLAKTVKLHGWSSIRSRVMIRTLYKLIAYGGSLAAGWAIDHAMRAGDAAQIMVTTLAVITEAKSIAENSQALGFAWPSSLLKRLDAWQSEADDDDERD